MWALFLQASCMLLEVEANRLTDHSFQQVQGLSAIQTSLRFLPNVGIILNVTTGLLVHKIRADHLVLITSLISAGSPLLMALLNPHWPYWYAVFWAVLLGPLSVDGPSSLRSQIPSPTASRQHH